MSPPDVILCATVAHSATRFICDGVFKSCGYAREDLGDVPPSEDRKTILQVHFSGSNYIRICEEAKKYPVIMSLRRPRSIIKSWRKRYNNTSGLYTQMMLSYYFIQTHEPLLLPVEEPDRAAYLHFMGKALGLDLRTDWEKIGTSIAQERPFNDVDIQMEEVLTSIYYQILERG